MATQNDVKDNAEEAQALVAMERGEGTGYLQKSIRNKRK
jgi:hypothetical protein